MALVLVAALVLLGAATSGAIESAAGRKDPARAITSQLICPCSCGEILSGCTCETGKTMQAFVADELKAGKGKDAITAELVSKYGEVILGAPKAEGFNLIVWVAPFLATIVGFVIAGLVLRRWVRRREVVAVGALGGAAAGPPGGVAGGPPGGAGGGRPTTAEEDLEALRARAEAELRRLQE